MAEQTPPFRELTAREREVLAMVADGHTNREIGVALFISESTAGVHVSNIMSKLGVASRTEAATVAIRAGLVEGGVPDAPGAVPMADTPRDADPSALRVDDAPQDSSSARRLVGAGEGPVASPPSVDHHRRRQRRGAGRNRHRPGRRHPHRRALE